MRSTRGQRLLPTAGGVMIAVPIALGVVSASPQRGQLPATASARFDVTSVKPSTLDAIAGNGFRITPGSLRSVNTTVEHLVRFAYEIDLGDREALAGGSSWVRSDRFEIEGKAHEAVPLPGLRAMLKSLLADRFKLALHEEMREREIYALVFAAAARTMGPALKPTPASEVAHCTAIESQPAPDPEYGPDGMRRCSMSSRGGIKLRGRPIADLAKMLGELVGRTVIDRTGITGRIDADLNATLNWDHLVLGTPSDTLGTNAVIFTALREQLGLRLESARGPVRTIVIDSVERPAAD